MTNLAIKLALPESMDDWADKNGALVQKIERRLVEKKTIAEEMIWGMIAEGCLPDWVKAKVTMDRTGAAVADATSDDNIPLGSIGFGLNGGDLDKLVRQHNKALSEFTMIDETLRAQKEPRELLRAAKKAMGVIALAEDNAKLGDRANKQFGRMIKEMKNTKSTIFERKIFNSISKSGNDSAFTMFNNGLKSFLGSILKSEKPAVTLAVNPVVNKPNPFQRKM